MQKQEEEEVPQDSGQRMDTMGGEDSYGDEYYGEKRDLGGLAEDDRLEVNMEDLPDDDSDDDGAIDLTSKPADKEKEKEEP